MQEYVREVFLVENKEKREVLIGQEHCSHEVSIDFYQRTEEYEYYREGVRKRLFQYFVGKDEDPKFTEDSGESVFTISSCLHAFRSLVSDKARVLEKGKGLGNNFWVKFIIPIKKITPLIATLSFSYKNNTLLLLSNPNNQKRLYWEDDYIRSELYFKEESSVKYQVAVYEKGISPEIEEEEKGQEPDRDPIVNVSGYHNDMKFTSYNRKRLFQNILYYGEDPEEVQRAREASKAVFSLLQKLLFKEGEIEDREVSLVNSVAKEYLKNIYDKFGVSKDGLHLCLPTPSNKAGIDAEELILGTKLKSRLGQGLDRGQVEGACSVAEALIAYVESEVLDEKDLEDREEEDGYYRMYDDNEDKTIQVAKLFDFIASKRALCRVFQVLSSLVEEDDGKRFAEILSPDRIKNMPRPRSNPVLSIAVYNSFGTQDWSKGEFPVGADVKFELNSGHYSIHLHAFGKKFSIFLSPFEVTTRRILVSRARRIIHGVFGS